ncbi:MAG: D-ribose pyranase [Peptostreptococcus sp.]|uniref:D-ribose pyranase n=1 Tax=Peptostreptococcus sp. TaxID=1262 RepID=UPI002FCC181C
MKKHGILNSEISKVLSDLGHTDQITIADCGLPVPDGVAKIDLAIKLGTPSFQDVLEIILEDMKIEKVILAEEIRDKNSDQLGDIENRLKKHYPSKGLVDSFNKKNPVESEFVSHEDLKKLTKNSKVIIRTGEASPYSNIILQSGVIF